jgi:hypothetical protein
MSPIKDAKIKNIDHLGIVAGLIDEIGIVEIINSKLGIDPREKIADISQSYFNQWIRICIKTIVFI